MALGHEIAGMVEEVGAGVSHLPVGQRVAINPSQPYGACTYCWEGARHPCLDMHFIGSAMRYPHARGGFSQSLAVSSEPAVPVGAAVSMAEAAMAEPLAVCLHAARQAGSLMGKRVLVTGCGPIGALCIVVARLAGAREIVVTDIASYAASKGSFDVLFEASGNEQALVRSLDVIRPRGIVVQVGVGGQMTLPMNAVVTKELNIRGTFRFDSEFQLAVDLMDRRLIDLTPLASATLPFERAVEAFELASDRSQSMKVQAVAPADLIAICKYKYDGLQAPEGSSHTSDSRRHPFCRDGSSRNSLRSAEHALLPVSDATSSEVLMQIPCPCGASL